MKSFRLVVVFLSLVLVASSLEAGELFTLSHAAPDQELEWGKAFDRVEPVEFNLGALVKGAPYVQSEDNSALRMEIVVDGIHYSLRRELWEKRGHNDFSWFGKVDGAQFLSHFAVVDGAVAGEVTLPFNTPFGFHRSILSRGEGEYLVKWNHEEISRSLQDVNRGSGKIQVAPLSQLAGRRRAVEHPSNCSGKNLVQNIDQMVLYTKYARAWFSPEVEKGDAQIRAFAQNGVDATNATSINTTGGRNYWVNLVYAGLIDHEDAFLSGGWLSDELEWVSKDPEVARLRNLYKADAVFLAVSGNTGNAAGLASPFTGPTAGFCVGMVQYGAYVHTHENGHTLWGMGHSPEDWTNPDPVWATDHYVDGVFAGVMGASAAARLCPKGCPIAYVWANPNVLFQGVPTGILNERENWRMLAQLTPTVSRFRISGNEEKCVASASFN